VTVAQVGEFGLINRLATRLESTRPKNLRVGIGDDAAAWLPTPGTLTVATTDALVEGVHFDLATTSWCDLGWKALAENVSDIAAMGCQPRYALIALGAHQDQPVADLESLYDGLAECAEAYGCAVVGGDVVYAPCVVIQVTLVGESQPTHDQGSDPALLRRSAARPGDTLAVTGPLGASAAGLRLLAASAPRLTSRRSQVEDALVAAHCRPQPRVTAGLALVDAGVRCAIDVSDGLVADVGHLCELSGVDAEIEVDRVPIHPAAATRFAEEAREMALSGGEDYELICAAPEEVLERASEMLRMRGEPPLLRIGSVVAQAGPEPSVRVRDAAGLLVPIGRAGYQHFDRSVPSSVRGLP
jgi:thiamine-monophosphate kinase